MKIAYLIPEYPGQTHIFFWREMNAMRELGVDVQVVSTRRPPANIMSHRWSQQELSRTTYLFPMSIRHLKDALLALICAGPHRWLRCLAAILGADQAGVWARLRMLPLILPGALLGFLARRNKWSHVHVHSCSHSALVALFAYILCGIDYSLTLHGPLGMYGPAQELKWRHATFGIAVTRRLRDEILQRVPCTDGRIEVAAMGVDLNVFKRRSPYEPVHESECCQIVTCGRLHRGKGHQDVIQAVKILKDSGLPARLSILGEGPARAMLEDRIKAMELASDVCLAGAVSEEMVRDHLDCAHIFVLGSHDEAIGVAIMEAMAMGLPVVVTDVGGVRELVREGVDGLFVPPQEPKAIAEAVAKIIRNREMAARMGRAGASRVRDHFGSHVSAQAIAACMQRSDVKANAAHHAAGAPIG